MYAFESPATYTRSGSPGALGTSAVTTPGPGSALGAGVAVDDVTGAVVEANDDERGSDGGATSRGASADRSTVTVGAGGEAVTTTRAAAIPTAAVVNASGAVRRGSRSPCRMGSSSTRADSSARARL